MENGLISNKKITASSKYDGNHAAFRGRLHFTKFKSRKGAWSAGSKDANQWLQVDLGSQQTKVTGVATQGRNADYEQWVTKYKLQYSNDGENFQNYTQQGQTTDRVKQNFSVVHRNADWLLLFNYKLAFFFGTPKGSLDYISPGLGRRTSRETASGPSKYYTVSFD